MVGSLVWPGSFTFFQNGKQSSIYVGNGLKFSEKLRPFPLSPPELNQDPAEYGEFVLPEPKVLSQEEIVTKVGDVFDEVWGKYDSVFDGGEESGTIEFDDTAKLAADIKGKINGSEEPLDVNTEVL